jgi:hypothetical protein
LVDGDELSTGFVDADEVAFVDGDVAGAACKRGADGAVIELEAGVGGGGFAGELLGLERAGGVGDGLKLFLGDEGAVAEGAVAVDLGEGGAELDFDALEVGFGRAQAILEGPGIDLEEDITLADILAFGEIDFHECACDLRAHGGGAAGFDGADGLEVEGYDLAFDFACDNRGGCTGSATASSGGFIGATAQTHRDGNAHNTEQPDVRTGQEILGQHGDKKEIKVLNLSLLGVNV